MKKFKTLLENADIRFTERTDGKLVVHRPQFPRSLKYIPSGVIIDGALNLMLSSKIKKIPDDIQFTGSVDLDNSSVETFDVFTNKIIGGYMDLSYTKCTKLPSGMCISKSLSFVETPIDYIPPGTYVGNFIYGGICFNHMYGMLVGGYFTDMGILS